MSYDFAWGLKYRQLLVFLRNLLHEMETDTEKNHSSLKFNRFRPLALPKLRAFQG